MVQKNVVLIETLEGGGTGILYPCSVRKNYFEEIERWENSWQYVLVLTNAHVLNTIGLNEQEKEKDFKPQILLHIYDNMQKEIPQSSIKKILVYNPGYFLDGKDDIAALLVALDSVISLTLEEKIDSRILENREEIFMEGYPGVLYEDFVSGRLQLQGIEKKVFPINEEVGVYQITDDYHWYNGMKDRQLLQGLSGSPVYRTQGGEPYLLGMVQSVSDIQYGENPFKLMYYIRFSYIFKHLRTANCIIYKRRDEYTWELEWIYGEKEKKKEKKVSILLLGGSGAGKSSLSKSFAYHGNELYSTNDGQTTRTKVIYDYSIVCPEAKVEVKFLTQAEFCDRMMKKIGRKPALFLFKELLVLDEKSVENEMEFLENCYKLLRLIEKKEEIDRYPNILGDVRAIKDGKLDNLQILSCYENILDIFWERISFPNVRFLLDNRCLNKIREKYLVGNEESKVDKLKQNKDLPKDIVENLKYLVEYCEVEDNYEEAFIKFQENMIEAIYRKNKGLKKHQDFSDQSIYSNLEKAEFIKKYQDILLFCEGYFDIQEFNAILPSNYRQQFYETLKSTKSDQNNKVQLADKLFKINEIEEEGEEATYFGKKPGIKQILQFRSGMQDYYKAVHRILKEQLQKNYNIKDNKMIFDLNDMDQEKRRALQQCLQVTSKGSLTGIVNYIQVKDMISDEYAFVLQELGILNLQLVDTCGLDHVDVKQPNVLKHMLYENRYYYDDKELVSMHEISIVYLKKLDSGRPDELRTVLPCVREVFPASPVYCLFTGIDIFYRTPEEIAAIHWKRENDNMPKAVKYILSDKFRKDCNIDENMYIVMRNNLIPYCGKAEFVKKCFQMYHNNVTYIRKLLASITMMEYSSLEIVEWGLLKKVLDKMKKKSWNYAIEDFEGKEKELVEETEKLVRKIFEKASLQSYSFRYNTKQADILSFCKRNNMGYSGTYYHQLNQRFHEGYSKAIMESGKDLAQLFKPKESAVIAAMKNLEKLYLGDGKNLIKVDLEENKKNKFRKTLDEMFGKDCYKYNPLQDDLRKEVAKKRNEIFDDIFNFKKGLENTDISKKFVIHYLQCLKVQIVNDNSIKSKNMLKLNSNFTDVLQKLKNEYMEKYRGEKNNDCEMEKRFNELMQYYFTLSKKDNDSTDNM